MDCVNWDMIIFMDVYFHSSHVCIYTSLYVIQGNANPFWIDWVISCKYRVITTCRVMWLYILYFKSVNLGLVCPLHPDDKLSILNRTTISCMYAATEVSANNSLICLRNLGFSFEIHTRVQRHKLWSASAAFANSWSLPLPRTFSFCITDTCPMRLTWVDPL